MAIFFFFIAVFIFVIMLLTFMSTLKPKDNLWFGVSFPCYALEDERLRELRISTGEMYKKYGFLLILLLIPILFLSSYISLSLIFFYVWTCAMVLLLRIPFIKAHRAATQLKRENEWFVGEKRMVRIDTKLSLLKKKMGLSLYWYIIPTLIAALSFTIPVPKGSIEILRMAGGTALGLTVFFFVIAVSFNRMKPKVYTDNSETNILLNQTNRRYWSLLWFGMAIINSCIAVITVYALSLNGTASTIVWSLGIFFVSVVPVLGIFYVHYKLKQFETTLLKGEHEILYTDDDEYWINGTTYNNPNDRSVMVPKRLGIGTTINIGTKTGKSIYYGLFVFVALLLIGTGWMGVQADFSTPTLTADGKGTVSIKYPMYNYSFAMKDVQELKLVDSYPSGGRRTNGVATDTVAIGNFKFEEYGKSKAYLVKNSPPYIVIKLPEVYVLYNAKDATETERTYAELQKGSGIFH
ncbi:hypothetical protein R50345_10270 [Paenibacillus sp. FSL R5-0345]|uniref:DUF5808 domain-containing protein n=1 Tax=Paenibacillus sp. FSL R5-0345 TaxID=1536770 RepID=UPI0004F5D68C|nr:DUF5808 domain-containing protein [Paenibacillus sp. FSL R5-0345]AIQ34953.1 hypothetical protein R50345_10270 [Paenibacillus sp. FSL R5-0345]